MLAHHASKLVSAGAFILASAAFWLTSVAQAQAPAAEWAKITAAAKKEGKLQLYTAQPIPVVIRVVEGFKKAYPEIAVEYQRGPSGPAMAKIDQERAGNLDGADVWVSSEFGWYAARAKDGQLLKPMGPAVAAWPQQFMREGGVVVPAREPFVILYNKTLVSNPPKGYADLLRPEFKGKIGSTDIVATILVAWYDWLENTQGAGYLAKLKAQEPKMYVGSTPMLQAVGSGEIAVAAFAVPTESKPFIEKGAPVEIVFPNPGLGIEYAMAGFNWSKRPNAALVFMDYLMSAEGQTIWHGRGESASPLPGIKGSLPVSSVTPWDPNAYPPDVAKTARERWMRIFK